MKYMNIFNNVIAIAVIGGFVWLACTANQAYPPKQVLPISQEDRLSMEAIAAIHWAIS